MLFRPDFALFLASQPGFFTRPFAKILGFIYNLLFMFIYRFTQSGSFGYAIILFTILIKLLLTPLNRYQQKQSELSQEINKQIPQIREKYKNKTDVRSQQLMNAEISQLYAKNGTNMYKGCLPALIQMPILLALFYVFRNAYMYIGTIREIYMQLSSLILAQGRTFIMDVIFPICLKTRGFASVNIADPLNMMALISKLNDGQLNNIISQCQYNVEKILQLTQQKNQIEYFFGINLVENPGFAFPAIIIPILAVITSFLQSKVTVKNMNISADNPAAAQQKQMMYVLPLIMGISSITLPAGLGLYWVVGNIVTIIQYQFFYSKTNTKREVSS